MHTAILEGHFLPAHVSNLRLVITQVHVKADQIQSADPHDGIDDPGKPGHISKQKCH